jgi:hypothetical protein
LICPEELQVTTWIEARRCQTLKVERRRRGEQAGKAMVAKIKKAVCTRVSNEYPVPSGSCEKLFVVLVF